MSNNETLDDLAYLLEGRRLRYQRMKLEGATCAMLDHARADIREMVRRFAQRVRAIEVQRCLDEKLLHDCNEEQVDARIKELGSE